MSFPAMESSVHDAGMRGARRTVYAWCLVHLHHHEVRDARLLTIELATGLSRAPISRALTWLVQRGYLREHAPGPERRRRLTLEWQRPGKAERRARRQPIPRRILAALATDAPPDTIALGAALALPVGRLRRELAQLARAGHVRCVASADGRRPSRWALTPQGVALVADSATPLAPDHPDPDA
jgi:DNA-binding MarR family transcriptional regulator